MKINQIDSLSFVPRSRTLHCLTWKVTLSYATSDRLPSTWNIYQLPARCTLIMFIFRSMSCPPSLLIVMPGLGVLQVLPRLPYVVWGPQTVLDHPRGSVATGPALVVLTVISEFTSAGNHQATLKNKICYSQILEYTHSTPKGPHSEVKRREKRRACEPGALPLSGSKVGVLRVSRVHSIGEFKA